MGFNGIKFFELVRVITNNHNWGADLANFFDTLGCSWTFFCFLLPNIYGFNFQSESCVHQIKEQYLFKQQMLHETYRP